MNYLMKAKLSQDRKEELFEDTKLEFNPRLMWCDLNGPNGLPYKYLYNFVVFFCKISYVFRPLFLMSQSYTKKYILFSNINIIWQRDYSTFLIILRNFKDQYLHLFHLMGLRNFDCFILNVTLSAVFFFLWCAFF